METGTKAAGEKGRSTERERFTTRTRASFMKGFGWTETQNVALFVILEGKKP